MSIAAALEQAYPGISFTLEEDADGNYSLTWPISPAPTQADIDAAISNYTAPSVPDWDGFNAAMLGDANYTAVLVTARAAIPSLVEAMPAAYLQVAQGNLTTFTVVLNAIYTAASVGTAQRDIWADRAESFALPADFVAVVRGAS